LFGIQKAVTYPKDFFMTLPHWTLAVHHDGSEAYVSNPFPHNGETITLSVRVPNDAAIKGVYCRIMEDGEFVHRTMKLTHTRGLSNLWSLDVTLRQPRVEYAFKILTDEGAYYYSAYGISRADHPTFYDFFLLADYEAPHWVRDTVFYQIFPDRFHNGNSDNDVQDGEWEREGKKTRRLEWGSEPIPWAKGRSVDFFGGDLEGVTQKLDYLTELGVNAIYLTPIFTSPSNHRYDISTFNEVDPHLGGNQALADLRAETLKRNIKLMLDITPNHVGISHYWIEETKQDAPTNTREYFFYDEKTQSFETWLGVSTLIKLNYGSVKLREKMYRDADSAMRRWMQAPYSIDGWRLDVANMTGNLRMNQLDHEVWQDMRPYIKQDHPDFYLLGEYFQDGTPHTQGKELDAAMNYQGFNTPTRRWLGGMDLGVADDQAWGDTALMPTDALAEQYARFLGAVPFVIALQQFNQLGSHDVPRILTVTKGDLALAKLGAALLMCYVGTPCIYYGDEIGMEGVKDPDNRRCMMWEADKQNAELLATYQQMIAIRHENSALRQGGYQLLFAQDNTLSFLREDKTQKIVFVGHRGQNETVSIPVWQGGIADNTPMTDLVSGASYTVGDGHIELQLAHGQAVVLR
jgi:alpha-glucosidase